MTSFNEKCAAVVQLHSTGKTPSEIFALLRCASYSRSFIYRVIKRHINGLPQNDGRGRVKKCSIRTPELIKKVKSKLRRNPARSGRKMAAEYGISKSTMQRILKINLHTHAYKLRKAHMMTMQQRAQRKKKCCALLRRFADADVRKIIFSDEKMFNIEQKWNSQNNRIYSPSLAAIPDGMNRRQRSLHPASVMVWAAVSHNGNSSLHFLDQGVKINQHNYLTDVLQAHVKPLGKRLFPQGEWCFQQDSAPAHKSNLCQQ
jgi:inhibitor of nuclear factor kappa-B kinase subunit alpha